MTIQIDTSDYATTYGHSPKGHSLGHWSFYLGRDGAWTEVKFVGRYNTAKAFAKREAKALGCSTILVMA